MRMLVRTRAWLLFVLMAICPVAFSMYVILIPSPRGVEIGLITLAIGFAVGVPLVWIWSAGRLLYKQGGPASNVPLILFNIAAAIQVVFWLSLAIGIPASSSTVSDAVSTGLPVAASAGMIFCALFFVARLVRAEGGGRRPIFVGVVATLVVMMPALAVWFIQPRVNRVFKV